MKGRWGKGAGKAAGGFEPFRAGAERMQAGDAAGAAREFEAVAERARQQDRPGMAARGGALAARALVVAGDPRWKQVCEVALADAGNGGPRAWDAFTPVVRTLHRKGMTPDAEWLASRLGGRVGPIEATPTRLPSNCDNCGAPVSSDDGADCGYCGARLS